MAPISKTCKICGEYHKQINKHIRDIHNIEPAEYVPTYLRDEMNGYCEICGNSTKYDVRNRHFLKYCSDECRLIGLHKKMTKVWSDIAHDEAKLAKFKLKTRIGSKKGFASMSKENKATYSKSRSAAAIKQHQNTSPERRAKINAKISKTVHDNWNNLSEEEKHEHSRKTSEGLCNRSQEAKDISNQKRSETYKNKSNAEKSEMMRNRHRLSGDEKYFVDKCKEFHIDYLNEEFTDEYPYPCDFIIGNLFIELHCSSFHNGHFYGEKESDEEYKAKLEELAIDSNWYNTKLIVWTESDIEKRDYAVEHNLNYIVLWNRNHIDSFLEDYKDLSGYIDYNHFIKE